MDTKVSEPVQGAGEGGAGRDPVSQGLTLMQGGDVSLRNRVHDYKRFWKLSPRP